MRIETTNHSDGSKHVTAVDNDGKGVMRAYFEPSGICSEIVAHGFDDQGRGIGWLVLNSVGIVVRRTEIKYGHAAHETEVLEFDGASNLIRRTEYDVNEAGRAVAERHFDGGNVQRSRAVITYSENGEMTKKYYDNMGNEIPRPAA